MESTLFLARVAVRGRTNKIGRRWCLFDGECTMLGESGESRRSLILRWSVTFAENPRRVQRYLYTMSEAELDQKIADLRAKSRTS
jgi:hypothetical protein